MCVLIYLCWDEIVRITLGLARMDFWVLFKLRFDLS